MTDYTPTTKQIRSAWWMKRWDSKGQSRSEGSDAEFDRWLAAHDAGVRAGVVAEEPEWEYGVRGEEIVRRRKAGQWVPVKQEGAEQ